MQAALACRGLRVRPYQTWLSYPGGQTQTKPVSDAVGGHLPQA